MKVKTPVKNPLSTRIISLIVALVMVLGSFQLTIQPASATDTASTFTLYVTDKAGVNQPVGSWNYDSENKTFVDKTDGTEATFITTYDNSTYLRYSGTDKFCTRMAVCTKGILLSDLRDYASLKTGIPLDDNATVNVGGTYSDLVNRYYYPSYIINGTFDDTGKVTVPPVLAILSYNQRNLAGSANSGWGSATTLTAINGGVEVPVVTDNASLEYAYNILYQGADDAKSLRFLPGQTTSNDYNLGSMSTYGVSGLAFCPAYLNIATSVTDEDGSSTATATVTTNDGYMKAYAGEAVSFTVTSSNVIDTVGITDTPGNTVEVNETGDNYSFTMPTSAVTIHIALKGNDATLSGLTISSGTLSPTFDPDITQYTATVAYSVENMTVTPTATRDNATFTVSPGQTSDLTVGANVITIDVTAQDEITTQTYTLTVTRVSAEASTDASLSGLTLSSGTLSPDFTADNLTYTASAANSIRSITVTPAATGSGATITVNGNTIASGEASGAISLAEGVNTIEIIVTAADCVTTRTYTITFTRESALTPPALTADTTDNTAGKHIDITFTDDTAWRLAITGITVDGTALAASQYTVNSGDINIAPVFTAANNAIVVTADGYFDAEITQPMTAYNQYALLYGNSITVTTLNNVFECWGLAMDSAGNLYISDTDNGKILKMDTAGSVSETGIPVGNPLGLKLDSAGNLYIADMGNNCILKVDTSGNTTTVTSAQKPHNIAIDSAGNLYYDSGSTTVLKRDTSGNITTVASSFTSIAGLAVDSAGNLYVGEFEGGVSKIDTDGNITDSGVTGCSTCDVAVDGADNLYIVDDQGSVRKMDASGNMTTLSYCDYPSAITVDNEGNLYFATMDIDGVGYGYLKHVYINTIPALTTLTLSGSPNTSYVDNAVTYDLSGLTLAGTDQFSNTFDPSGLEVTWAVVSGSATISGSTLTITGSGSVSVTATIDGITSNALTAAESYSVTIGSVTGGTITADNTSASPGDNVTLTITPDNGTQLYAATLKASYTSGADNLTAALTAVDNTTYTFTMPAADVTVTATFVWDGSMDITWYTSDMSATAYTLYTPAQLKGFGYMVSASAAQWTALGLSTSNPDYYYSTTYSVQRFVGKTITLANDMWLNKVASTTKGDATQNVWISIGGGGTNNGGTASTQYSFGGVFNGAGHTVYNIYIDRGAYSSDWASNTGFFGLVPAIGTVKNLTVTGFVDADRSVGGVVGKSWGTVENCTNYCTVKNYQSKGVGGVVGALWVDSAGFIPVVRGCTNYGAVETAYSTGICGGVVGDSEGTVDHCINHGAISATNAGTANVGGVVGNVKGAVNTITNCYNDGTITRGQWIGGILGEVQSAPLTIKNCYNQGNVTGGGNSDYVGGLIGKNLGTSTAITATNCYNTGIITQTAGYAGGIIGLRNSYDAFTNCYYLNTSASKGVGSGTDSGTAENSTYMKSADFVTLVNGTGRAFVNPNINSDYPILRVNTTDNTTITSITKGSDPTTLSYVEGMTFSTAGLAIWANYSDGTREQITDYTISKTTALATTDTLITISGTYNGITYSYDFTITVVAKALSSISITTSPTNILYAAGETFSTAGMVVKATFTNGSTTTLTTDNYTLSPTTATPLTASDTKITVSYTYEGVTATADQSITVLTSAAPSQNSDSVYELYTVNDMRWFANQVNTGLNRSICGKVMNDIDLTAVTWTPIGSGSSKAYTGTFDGNSQTVTLALSQSSTSYTGLFGYVSSATINKLTVAGSVSGSTYTGGITGYAAGASSITNCINNASVTCASYNAGGIAGYSTGTTAITGCTNKGTITGSSYCVGGITGYSGSTGTISQCVNTGSITGTYQVGGIAGNNYSTGAIQQCGNTGAVTATSAATTSTYSAGGIAGYNYAASTIDQCYNTGAISGGVMNVGGLVGYLTDASSKVTNAYNTGSVTSTSTSSTAHTGGVAGYTKVAGCTVKNTYNSGAITANYTTYTAGVIGYATGTTNVSNNYYLYGTASIGLGYSTDNTTSKTSAELKALASTLGAYFQTATNYPVLTWQAVNVTGVSLNKSSVTLLEGSTAQLTAAVTPENTTDTNVSWTSSDSDVATVSSTGLVTAVAAGSATITVTTENGSYTANCTVAVKNYVDLSLSPSTGSVAAGQTFDVGIEVQNGNQKTAGIDAYLDFDPAKLMVVDMDNATSGVQITNGNTLTTDIQNSANNTDGYIKYSAGVLGSAYPSGTFTLATIRFKALAETSTDAAVTFSTSYARPTTIVNDSDADVTGTLTGGTYEITAGLDMDVAVVLQGSGRPDNAWIVPLTVKFFTPGASVLTAAPLYTFTENSTKDGSTAVITCTNIPLGTYDISVVSSHTLVNVKKNVEIGSTDTISLGTLLEGNANNDVRVNISDFGLLSLVYGYASTNPAYNAMADFDGSGVINISDFSLLSGNYALISPITTP